MSENKVEDAIDFDKAREESQIPKVSEAIPMPPVALPRAELPALADNSAHSMLAFMVQQNVDIDRMKAMIELVNAEEDRSARQTFDMKFAQMQAQFKPVPRTEKADFKTKSGDHAEYDYAPIEEMVKINGKVIGDHGFSYSFREQLLEGGKTRRFFIDIRGWGHTRETYVDLPEGGAMAPLMNGAQGSRSLQSYGQRYCMYAGFGFVTEGDDDDTAGLTFEVGVRLSNEIQLIRESTRENFRENYAMAIKDKAPEDVEVLAAIKQQLINQFKKEDASRTKK